MGQIIASGITGDIARQRLSERIERGKANATAVVERVQQEVPTDLIVGSPALEFKPNKTHLRLITEEHEFTLHPHALVQAAERTNIKGMSSVVREMTDLVRDPKKKKEEIDNWTLGAVASFLTDIYRHQLGQGNLLRVVNGQVRGFLSDKYRRMDGHAVMTAFLNEAAKLNAVIVDATYTETKWWVKIALPKVIDLGHGEYVIVGMVLKTSDFGDGALELSFYLERLVCINGLIMSVDMRKVHVGARLSQDINYSLETYNLDTQTMASAARDVVRHVLAPAQVDERIDNIKTAIDTEVNPDKALVALVRKNLITTTEKKAIAESFRSADITLMPAGSNVWRLSNAISLFSNSLDDAARSYELQRLAADVVEAAA